VSIARFDRIPDGVQVLQGGGTDPVAALTEIVDLIAQRSLDVPVAGTWPLEEAAAAVDASEHGHHAGKLVLVTS
jgi:NADPH:quinone reductase-like Zn-dependent oxidoreductase